MTAAEVVFWSCVLLAAHTYFFYPCLLFAAYALHQARCDYRYLAGRADRRRRHLRSDELPAVSIVIPAYNEQARLHAKIANLEQMDYPPEKLEVIFVSDGSTDRTNEILAGLADARIRMVLLPERMGKASALNHGVARASHEVLIFSDSATLFAPDALRKLTRHFSVDDVGVVCGALQFRGNAEHERTEGVYWRYETALRVMEARLGATLTASGAIYAMRRRCWVPLAANVVIDDFVIPMNARRLGARVLLDPEAVAIDFAAESVRDEFSRRVRLAVGSFRALGEFARIRLDPFTHLAFVSHKVLRWVLPFVMLGLLASSALLSDRLFYLAAFLGQVLFYLWAGLGYLFRDRLPETRYAHAGYFVLAMNLAFLVGFVRFLTGHDAVKWKRAKEAA
jgi:biofilm PGA synthesis N-glycosyltransferase PgaC